MAGIGQLSSARLRTLAMGFPSAHGMPASGLYLAILLSMAAHAAFLYLGGMPSGSASLQGSQPAGQQSRVGVRLTVPSHQTVRVAKDDSSPAVATGSMPLQPDLVAPEQVSATDVQALSAPKEPEPSSAEGQNSMALLPREVLEGYLPRADLSRGPVPLADIKLNWPDGLIPVGRNAGSFWLYIDESGSVRRFEADGPTLMPQLEEVARATFLAARFEPGQRDGQVVKSLIRIEVVFDNVQSNEPAPKVVSERLL